MIHTVVHILKRRADRILIIINRDGVELSFLPQETEHARDLVSHSKMANGEVRRGCLWSTRNYRTDIDRSSFIVLENIDPWSVPEIPRPS